MRATQQVGLLLASTLAVLLIVGNRTALMTYLASSTTQWILGIGTLLLALASYAGLLMWLYHLGKIKQQRRYGQYLDQLEAALRELSADEAA